MRAMDKKDFKWTVETEKELKKLKIALVELPALALLISRAKLSIFSHIQVSGQHNNSRKQILGEDVYIFRKPIHTRVDIRYFDM